MFTDAAILMAVGIRGCMAEKAPNESKMREVVTERLLDSAWQVLVVEAGDAVYLEAAAG